MNLWCRNCVFAYAVRLHLGCDTSEMDVNKSIDAVRIDELTGQAGPMGPPGSLDLRGATGAPGHPICLENYIYLLSLSIMSHQSTLDQHTMRTA